MCNQSKNQDDSQNRIILDYLIKQHQRVLSHIDSMDLKIAQILALNGLLLSFVFDKLFVAQNHFLFLTGLFCIIISLIIGVIVYTGMEVCDSPGKQFYIKSNDPEILKKNLLNDIFGVEKTEEKILKIDFPIKDNPISKHYQNFLKKIKRSFSVNSNEGNDKILRFKGQWFNIMIKLIIIGLIILVIGYYV